MSLLIILLIIEAVEVLEGRAVTVPNYFLRQSKLATLATCALDRDRPRTCTVDNATVATGNDDCGKLPLYVADLAIDPVTGQADFSNSVPILPHINASPQLREQMQQLLDMIMLFFEEEEKLVESGTLPEYEALFHDVQTNDSNTQHNTRPLPPQFNRRRA